MKIFLSHSSKDKPFVEHLAKDILALDIEVWLDKWEMRVGDSLYDKIAQGLETSDYLVVVLSKNSVNSSWVRKELNAFLCDEISSNNVKILPVLIDDCSIPIFLREKLYADFRDDYESGFQMLAEVITNPVENSEIFIEKINILKGISTENLCLDVIISNSTHKLVWASNFSLEAEIIISGSGFSPFMYKAEYQLKMPYYLKHLLSDSSKSIYQTIGQIYEGDDKEYYQECVGYFNYVNASTGLIWKIKITAPVQFKIMPKDKLALRVILLKPQKVLEREHKHGEMIARITYGVTLNQGEFRLEIDNGKELSYKISDCDKIIEFIANN